MAVIHGRIMQVTWGGAVIKCQTDATLEIDKDVQTGAPCKDDGGWATKFVGQKTWNITATVKNFLDSVPLNQLDLAEEMLSSTGDDPQTVTFTSTESEHSGTEDATFSGDAILANFTWNAPGDGESTSDLTFEGTGPLTLTRTPITT